MQGRTLYVYNRMAMGMRDNRARFIYDRLPLLSFATHRFAYFEGLSFYCYRPIVFQIVNLNMNFINCENPIGPTVWYLITLMRTYFVRKDDY